MGEKYIEVREGKNARKSSLSRTLAVKITQRQRRASHAVALLQHGRSRSRKGKKGRREKQSRKTYARIEHFIISSDELALSVIALLMRTGMTAR